MSKFRIVGIQYPGKVDIYGFGVVNLHLLEDDKLEEIRKKTNCQYIQPAIDAPANNTPINLGETPKNKKGKAQKKN